MVAWRLRQKEAGKSPRRRDNAGIYFIECEGFIKIGSSTDVAFRLRGIQASNPFTLQPIGFLPCTLDEIDELEESLHWEFHQARHRGEWFRATDALLTFIREHAQPWPGQSELRSVARGTSTPRGTSQEQPR